VALWASKKKRLGVPVHENMADLLDAPKQSPLLMHRTSSFQVLAPAGVHSDVHEHWRQQNASVREKDQFSIEELGSAGDYRELRNGSIVAFTEESLHLISTFLDRISPTRVVLITNSDAGDANVNYKPDPGWGAIREKKNVIAWFHNNVGSEIYPANVRGEKRHQSYALPFPVGAAGHWKLQDARAPDDLPGYLEALSTSYTHFSDKSELLACAGFGPGGLWVHGNTTVKQAARDNKYYNYETGQIQYRKHVVETLNTNGFSGCSMEYSKGDQWMATASKASFIASPVGAGWSCART
jgi:hypothetical protein